MTGGYYGTYRVFLVGWKKRFVFPAPEARYDCLIY